VLWQLLFAERHPIDLGHFFEAHLDLVLNGVAPPLNAQSGATE
jgi:hypothetical protein